MTNFYETEAGEVRCRFDVDYTCASLARFPASLVKAVVKGVEAFAPYAPSDRSYDAQAVLGKLWDARRASHVLLGQILSAVAALLSSPLEEDPDSPTSRKRYRVIF